MKTEDVIESCAQQVWTILKPLSASERSDVLGELNTYCCPACGRAYADSEDRACQCWNDE